MELVTYWLRLAANIVPLSEYLVKLPAESHGPASSGSSGMGESATRPAASAAGGPGDMTVPAEGNTWLALLYAGVNYSLAGTGGPQCVGYISTVHRLLETVLLVPLFVAALLWSYRRLPIPAARPPAGPAPPPLTIVDKRADDCDDGSACCGDRDRLLPDGAKWTPYVLRGPNGRRLLLAIYCCVFGVELGYKLCSRTVIYILNPCHLITAAQIAMLAVDDYEPSRHKARNIIYRLHVYAVAGSTLAMAFPVLNTRLRVWSRGVYWAQHWLILLTPIYLESLGGSYVMEPQPDFYTSVFAMAVLLLYHYVPLQAIGLLTGVNLNNVICPAVSDPFQCRYWRLICIVHQSAYVPLHTLVLVRATAVVGPLLGLGPPTTAKGASLPPTAAGAKIETVRMANGKDAGSLRLRTVGEPQPVQQ